MRIDRRLALWAALTSCAGCIGADLPTEGEEGADRVAYKTLTLKAAHTVGWPNLQEKYAGVSHVEKQSDEAVGATTDVVVFGPVGKRIDIDLDEPNWYWVAGSGTALILLHKELNAADDVPWRSVSCGNDWQQVKNGYRFFFDTVEVDLEGQTIEGMSFSSCGIGSSEHPQFAFAVVAWQDAGSMVGDYDYAVHATCDDQPCTNERGVYPEAVFADNPVATPSDPTLPQRASPSDAVRAYYRALGEGRVNDVVAAWNGLNPRAQSRLRQIAQNGRGWTWELPVIRETLQNDGLTAVVQVEVTAAKGNEKYMWQGTIDLTTVVQLNREDLTLPSTSSWKITAMHLTAVAL